MDLLRDFANLSSTERDLLQTQIDLHALTLESQADDLACANASFEKQIAEIYKEMRRDHSRDSAELQELVETYLCLSLITAQRERTLRATVAKLKARSEEIWTSLEWEAEGLAILSDSNESPF